MSVVLSYSRKDKEFADTVYQRLKSSGYDVWMDRPDIQVGTPWDRSIENAIDARSHIVVILSPSSVGSKNVADEWSYGLEKEKTIIPVYYQECDVPMRLHRLQRVNFDGEEFNEKFIELTKTLGEPDNRPEELLTNSPVDVLPKSALQGSQVLAAPISVPDAHQAADLRLMEHFPRYEMC